VFTEGFGENPLLIKTSAIIFTPVKPETIGVLDTEKITS